MFFVFQFSAYFHFVGTCRHPNIRNKEITNTSHITANTIPGELPSFTFQPNIFTRNETKLSIPRPTAEPRQYMPSKNTKCLPRLFSITCKTTWPRSIATIPPLANPLINLPTRGKYALMLTLYTTCAMTLSTQKQMKRNLGFSGRSAIDPNSGPATTAPLI